jgi:predicted enzyme related to lactoylglutathione lyase
MTLMRGRHLGWLIALVVAVTTGGGAGSAPKVAPGTFVWHDLVTDNLTACRTFYGELFGWTFEAGKGVDPDYTIIRHNGLPIGGIVIPRQAATSQWLSYVVVADVDKAVDAFRQSGGQVFRGPLNARGDLRVAAVADAQGAAIGLASRGPIGEMPQGVPDVNRWLWMDYVARDAGPAVEFYTRVFGFTSAVTETRQNVSYYRLSNDRPRAGLFATPWPRETSVWLPYVRVADPAASASRAKELGGTIVQAASPRLRNGSMAIVLDPSGAPLALQKYPFDAGATP